MAQDLQEKDNRLHRLFERFSNESKTISIASVSLVISVLALLMAWMSVYDAIHAKTQVEIMLESNADLKKEVRILQNKIDRYNAELHAQGDH